MPKRSASPINRSPNIPGGFPSKPPREISRQLTLAFLVCRVPSAYAIKPISAFYCFLVAGIVSAVFAPIQDCDETFNYFEPTHYLSHGYGLQTWEYDPEYAIRSWLYVGVHAVVGSIRRLLPQSSKVGEFYFIRYALAFTCALCQTLLYCVLSTTLSARIGVIFILATILSAGNFHASTAFLPSSFAMYTGMLGAAAFMNWRGGLKTSQGIAWFAAGAIFGWPFAGALCLPFLFEEGLLALLSDKDRFIECLLRVGRGAVAAVLLVVSFTAPICLDTPLLIQAARRSCHQCLLLQKASGCDLEYHQVQCPWRRWWP